VPSFIFPASSADLVYGILTNDEFRIALGRSLKCFDTGIDRIDFEQVDFEKLELHPSFRRRVENSVKNKRLLTLNGPDDSYWLFDRDGEGNPRSWKLIAHHKGATGTGKQAVFEIREESDGTRRLMHLVPAMMALTKGNFLVAIDELDRSLHPEVLHSYVANFLKYSTGRSSQLIVTTHDTTLLKQPFLRRDEVWFVEKGSDQSSRLVGLEEFKKGKRESDLQQDYLQGRFGGVPVIRDFSWLGENDGTGA
jgi:uncharacterized protein